MLLINILYLRNIYMGIYNYIYITNQAIHFTHVMQCICLDECIGGLACVLRAYACMCE